MVCDGGAKPRQPLGYGAGMGGTLAEKMLAELEAKQLTCAHDLMSRGNWRGELGHWSDAFADYDAAVRDEPDHEGGMCWHNRGNALLHLGRKEEAAQSYLEATKYRLGARNATTWTNAAIMFAECGRFDEARATIARYLALKPDPQARYESPGLAHNKLGYIENLAGNIGAAMAAYARACEVEPEDVLYWRSAGDYCALSAGEPARALHFYEGYLARTEGDAAARSTALVRLAFARFQNGDVDGARAAWHAAVDSDPDDPPSAWALPLVEPYPAWKAALRALMVG
jgi:tetratricopeptide (TPR) repeat protein